MKRTKGTRAARKGLTMTRTSRQVGLAHGFRSGLEDAIAEQLKEAGIPVDYENHRIDYVVPERVARYTPDFVLPNGIVVESKGQFVPKDRQKHLLIKSQHPELDLRFVFTRPNQRISKQSKTTYAMWCEKHGFQFAKGEIPKAWLKERRQVKRLTAITKWRKSEAK